MYKIYAYWSTPKAEDLDEFEDYYCGQHLLRASAVPSLLRLVTTRTSDIFGTGDANAHHRVAEMTFPDSDAFRASTKSKEWRAMRQCGKEICQRFDVKMSVDMGEVTEHALPSFRIDR